MLLAGTDVQRSLEEVLTDWARQPVVASARRRAADVAGHAEPGAAPAGDMWDRLGELGLLEMPVPEADGGTGASLADLAVVLERLGHALVPGGYLPTVGAAVVLAAARREEWSGPALSGIATGTTRAAITLDAYLSCDAQGRLHGSAGLVLGATEASLLVVCEPGRDGRCWLVESDSEGLSVRPRTAVDVTRSLAEVRLQAVAPVGRLVGVDAGFARDVLLACLAAEAAGIAGWCLETAVEYAKVRRQFDRPIGSFQAIKHLCADMAVLRESVAAAAWDAASCPDDAGQFELAVAAAADVALDAAVEVAKSCIQVLGGIGCTWEHDAHLYLRRATTVRLLAGSARAHRRRIGGLVLEGRRRTPPPLLSADGVGGYEESYDEARACADRVASLPAEKQRTVLVDEGYLVPTWPRPYGRAASAVEAVAIATAFEDAGVTVPDLVIGNWLVRAIADHGDDAQRERYVPPTLRGEAAWCQLFSEPEAGSDLASLRTRATRVPGGWRLDGQKVWTSLAREADFGLCLARTDPEAPKHHGITAFVVDMTTAGIEIRPLREMSGEARFNEVFLDGVVVGEDAVIGPVDGGWRVANAALATERLAMGSRHRITPSMSRLLEALATSASVREEWLGEVGGLLARSLVANANDRRVALAGLTGAAAGALPMVSKLMGVQLTQDEREAVLRIHGAAGAVDEGEQREWVRDFLSGRALSIAGGSAQILRNLLAERVLGLPRG